MRYIKPEIELNEIQTEDIMAASDGLWGNIVNIPGVGEGGDDRISLGGDENGNPQINADASFFG